ncbi:unnamed protein product [Caenorhabditis nigoni]
MASVHEIEEGETWRSHSKSAFMRSPDLSADEEEVNLTKTKSVHEVEESPYRHPSKPNMTLLSDDEEEGQVSVSNSPEKKENPADPLKIDFKSWKDKAGKLIQSENHVMMHSDEELRDAISQAMFLEVASENLISKRKRQIELIDKCRSEEIASAKRLFEENIDVYQRTLGPLFHEFSNELTTTLEKANRPVDVPDVTRPPPAFFPMPSMNVPPPPLPTSYNPASATPSMNAVTNEMAKTLIAPTPRVPPPLMSQHLLPPPVKQQDSSPVSRSDKEKNQHEEKKTHEHEHDSKPIKSLEPGSTHGFLSSSWRTPYHPVPVPPPKPFLFSPSVPPPPPIRRNPSVVRKNFIGINISSSSPRPSNGGSSGVVGINVRGVFVGNRPRPIPAFEDSPNSSDGF